MENNSNVLRVSASIKDLRSRVYIIVAYEYTRTFNTLNRIVKDSIHTDGLQYSTFLSHELSMFVSRFSDEHAVNTTFITEGMVTHVMRNFAKHMQ